MTPRIKKAYRHFNAFLQHYQCRQLFWRKVQEQANNAGLPYQLLKTKLLCCSRPQDWVISAFKWSPNLIDNTKLSWRDLSILWDEYSCNHNYFIR
jgi:hypothetical protein